MKYDLIGHGAEAKIYLIESNIKEDKWIFRFDKDTLNKLGIDYKEFEIKYNKNKIVLKYRYSKKYRNEKIDKRFIKYRTRIEGKILEKLYGKIYVPELIYIDEESGILIIEYIEGKRLSEVLDKLEYDKILREIGRIIGKMHKEKIVHGDLTTSNMIINDKIYLIDFGLSFFSSRIEDFATDLHLLKESLDSKHWNIKNSFQYVLEGYKEEIGDRYNEIYKRLNEIELRGRYKSVT